jgi:hypothetical protein
VPKLLERFAEQADLHSAAIVIQHHANAITAFANIDDQTGDSHLAPRLRVITLSASRLRGRLCREIGQTAVNETARVTAHCMERVSGQVKTERFLFIAQQQALRPLVHVHGNRGVFRLCRRLEAEHIVLAGRRGTRLLVGTL